MWPTQFHWTSSSPHWYTGLKQQLLRSRCIPAPLSCAPVDHRATVHERPPPMTWTPDQEDRRTHKIQPQLSFVCCFKIPVKVHVYLTRFCMQAIKFKGPIIWEWLRDYAKQKRSQNDALSCVCEIGKSTGQELCAQNLVKRCLQMHGYKIEAINPSLISE